MSKKLLAVIITIALVLSALAIWWLTRSRPAVTTPTESGSETVVPGSEFGTIPTPVTEPASEQQIAQTNLKNSALRFVEIYGSYSTDASYANLKSLDSIITPGLKQNLPSSLAAATPAQGFYGVTTRALTAQVESETGEQAVIVVSTQREELFSREGQPQLRYQDIRLTLLNQGGVWLVDNATWQ